MIFAVYLAAGHAKRFGSNKLLYEIQGVPMAERAFSARPAGMPGVVVTRSARVADMARAHPGLSVVMSSSDSDDVALSIRLGVGALPPEADGAMFFVCDQPWLGRLSVARLALCFERRPERIWVLSRGGRSGNPCVFPRRFFGELASLPENRPGKTVIRRHPEAVSFCEALRAEELEDIDRL